MYAKKDIIYSSTMGVCVVGDVTKLSADRSAPVLYYVLRSYYDKTKVAYIPVEEHEVELRDLLTEDEAEQLLDSIKTGINDEQDVASLDSNSLGEIAYVLKHDYEALYENLVEYASTLKEA